MTIEFTERLPIASGPAVPGGRIDCELGNGALPLPGNTSAIASLDVPGREVSFFEFWPWRIFYAPVALYWLWQAICHRSFTLPAIANPLMEHGGLCGESKVRLFQSMDPSGRNWLAPYVSVVRGKSSEVDHDVDRLLTLAKRENLGFPLVAKPDIGCHGAGVRVVKDAGELRHYVKSFPPGEVFLLQRLIEHEGEAGIFYVRKPEERTGHIFSLTLKFFPYVLGDGVSTLERLIHADSRAGRVPHLYIPRHRHRLTWVPAKNEKVRLVFSGNHCKGAVFRDARHLVTPELTQRIDELAKTIPSFHFGRFDVRFASLAGLRRGEDFTVVEFNGAGSEAIHIWDADTRLSDAYRDLFKQIRILFEIGAANRGKGHVPDSWFRILSAWRRELRLKQLYPIGE